MPTLSVPNRRCAAAFSLVLKGNGWSEITPEVWPIAVFMLVVIAIGLRFFRSIRLAIPINLGRGWSMRRS